MAALAGGQHFLPLGMGESIIAVAQVKSVEHVAGNIAFKMHGVHQAKRTGYRYL
jgi:hypothetical protein